MPYRASVGTTVGHIHLKVSELDRAIAFYRDVLGFELQQRYGDQAAFLSAGHYHHHIGFNTWHSKGITFTQPARRFHHIGFNTWHSKGTAPTPVQPAGLYHVAFLYPDRAALGGLAGGRRRDRDRRRRRSRCKRSGLFRAPDGNGIEALSRSRARGLAAG